MNLIIAFIYLIILILPFYHHSYSQVSDALATNHQNTNNQNINKNEAKKETEIKAKVEFFNKKSLTGRVVFQGSNIIVNHIDKNTKITLDTPYDSIEYIHPITWFPEFSRIEKDGKITYNFYPIEYIVKLRDGKYLNVVGRVPSFEVINFVHKYGKSKIYTYYVDYLIIDKKGETKWKNMGTYELNKNFKKPHPNVAYYIYFTD